MGIAYRPGMALFAVLSLPCLAAAAPTGVRPANDPGSWIRAEDYPVSALQNQASGTTRFRLDVDAEGHVSACTVVTGSGTDALDKATCSLLSARAAFMPALDRKGRAIASSYTNNVRWVAPDDGGQSDARVRFETCRSGADGAIMIETAFGCFH